MKIYIGKAFWMILCISAITLFLAKIVGDELIYRAFYFWIGLIVFSLIWTVVSLIDIEFSRKSRDYQFEVGEYLEEKYSIWNRSVLRNFWLEVNDLSEIGQIEPRLIAGIPSRTEKQYSAHRYLSKRGSYSLGPTILRSGDFFGLFQAKKWFPFTQSILVTPAIMQLTKFPLPGSELSGGVSTSDISNHTNALTSGVRDYLPGDPLKKIHWPSTIRHQKLIVKEYDKDPLAEAIIILDGYCEDQWEHDYKNKDINPWLIASKSMRRIIPSSFEYMTCLASSISLAFHKADIAFGLIYQEEGIHIIPPDKGERQYQKLLEQLSMIRGKAPNRLTEYSSAIVNEIRPGSQVTIVTATADPSLLDMVQDLLYRSMQVIVILLNRMSFNELPENNHIKAELDLMNVVCHYVDRVERVNDLENQMNSLINADKK